MRLSRTVLAVTGTLLSALAVAVEYPLPPEGEDIIGQEQVITAVHEDTFADLGDKYSLGYLEMVAANPGVDAWLPKEGTQITLPTRYVLPSGPREGVVINLAEYRLYYFPKGKNVVHTWAVGIGREGWGSPVSSTTIVSKTANPGWSPPKSILKEHLENDDPLPAYVPPGPNNPLGTRKMNLGIGSGSYLIHGTSKKFGIGMRVSHGCFRMMNHDVERFFAMVPVGTKVRIVNEPYKFGLSGGKVYLEAHAPIDDNGQPSIVDRHAAVINTLIKRDDLVGQVSLDWDAVRGVVGDERGMPVVIAEPGQQIGQNDTAPLETF